MSKISNVLCMIEYLSSGKKYSIQELSNLLEVSPRMIRVYKEEIEKAGIYIDTIKGPYGGYALRQKVTVPTRFINFDTIVLNNKKFFNQINKAITEKKKCIIEYYSKNEEQISYRTIHPYEMILFGNEWGVAAYCELKNEIRHFYINRMKNVKLSDNFQN